MMVDFPLDEQEIDTLLHQTDDAENVENGFCMDQAHKVSIWELWKSHTSENSLHIPIGIRLDGGILELDLHEKAHGPHGIIAGMTGSGKTMDNSLSRKMPLSLCKTIS